MTSDGSTLSTTHTVRHTSFTNALALAWGLSFTYLLFTAIFISHLFSSALACLVPLIVVWATLERKRWGRLSLLGISLTNLGLFTAALAYCGFHTSVSQLPDSMTGLCAKLALGLYTDSPALALTVLTLASVTLIWLSLPNASREFELSKPITIATAQRVIALLLVFFWALQMVCTPLV